MLSKKSFFSFLELTDPTRHREFNEYHQLDHRPANLALPGVVWGDRWVRTPACREASGPVEESLAGVHYVAMYLFGDPLSESVPEWQELGERAFQWGRKPDTDYSRRKVGFYIPLQGYVAPRVRVSADVLPFRPVRGMHVTVSRAHEPHASATEKMWSWYDRVRIPDLVSCDGVAGAWTFYNEWSTLAPKEEQREAGRIRITLLYLDEAPAVFLADRARLDARSQETGRHMDTSGIETVLFESPLEPIEPWKWDWFDGAAGA